MRVRRDEVKNVPPTVRDENKMLFSVLMIKYITK